MLDDFRNFAWWFLAISGSKLIHIAIETIFSSYKKNTLYVTYGTFYPCETRPPNCLIEDIF